MQPLSMDLTTKQKIVINKCLYRSELHVCTNRIAVEGEHDGHLTNRGKEVQRVEVLIHDAWSLFVHLRISATISCFKISPKMDI